MLMTVDVDDDDDGYATPAQAALSGWDSTPGSNAYEASVTMHGDSAEVIVDAEPSHPMSTRVDRSPSDGLWRLVSDWSI
jgi:hypothetical protein